MSQHPYGQQPSDPYQQQPAPYGQDQGHGQQPGRLNTQASYPSAGAHRYDPKAGPQQLIPGSEQPQQPASPYGQPHHPPVAPYAQQPAAPYGQPQQPSPYGQPQQASGQYGQPVGQPQQSAGADQGSLYQPGDEQRFPYGLPPEVVAQRRGQQSGVAQSQPSANDAPQSQPSAVPQSQPSAGYIPPSQPSAPAPHEPVPNPYSSYAPAPTSGPSPYSPSAERGPYAPYSGQELGGTHEPGEPYRQQGTGSYTGQSDDTNSGSRQREQSVFAPPSYPTYSSQPSAPQHETGETNLQLRSDERPANEGWVVEFDNGQRVEIHSLALIGRNPQPRPGEEAELITLGDETRKISKTHLAIGVDQRGIYLCDRGSTNGTAIENAPDDFRPCPEGEIVRLQEGQKISFGDHALYIRRQA